MTEPAAEPSTSRVAEPTTGPVVGPATPAPVAAVGPDAAPAFRKGATIRIIRDQLKVAHLVSDEGQPFTIYCDEPPAIGGNDEHPQPLHYLAAAVGF